MAAKYDITVDQGADFNDLQLTIENDGLPVNLTGYTFAAQMRLTHGDSTIAATFTPTVVDALAGQVSFSLTDVQTAALAARKHVYDIEMTDALGFVTRLLYGNANVTPEVTR